jgi:alpha-L-rhamnosidase
MAPSVVHFASALALASAAAPSPFTNSTPIWAANATSRFVVLRSPDFSLRGPPTAATLFFTALGSPRPPAGTIQSKLLGAACPYVNGILVTCGPGHNVPTASQVVRGVDVLPFLRAGAPNALGTVSFWDFAYATHAPIAGGPRVQAELHVSDAAGSYVVSSTSTAWLSWGADAAFSPTGDAGVSWYPMPNENLVRAASPGRAWSEPAFAVPQSWAPAVAAPAWPSSPTPFLYLEAAPPPAALARTACSVTALSSTRQVVDFGQEFVGGVNFSFVGAAAGARVRVTLGEELNADGSVHAPMRTGNFWSANWSLAGDARDAGVAHHEVVQFRYAQVDFADSTTPRLARGTAQAWVMQHAVGGTGVNPFESGCSTSTPAAQLWAGAPPPAVAPLGAFASSSAALDAVWRFCAYTIVATTVDVNVDGQTRERDVDVIDALNTARGQYSVFAGGDASVQERTLRELLTNDTGAWTQWFDFHASAVLAARDHALFAGDLAPARDAWGASDDAILGQNAAYNSLQFEAGVRYWNASGRGILAFPPDGSCGGSWACEPLVDWPTTTRDGYDCGKDNYEDTVRNALGALALGALADVGGWLGGAPAAAAPRFAAMAAATVRGLRALNWRTNGSEAFFVDGAAGAPAAHAAVHSTVMALAAGALDGDAPAIAAATRFLARHGVAPSSCMMGRWWVDALFRGGVWVADAADLALAVLTSAEYPGWLDMLAQGATTTMEAWRPADKANLDFAHPWCASPAFTIVSGLVGAAPLAPGWTHWRAAPQPGALAAFAAQIPTPAGRVNVSWAGAGGAAGENFTVTVGVLAGQTCNVCVVGGGADVWVDGARVANAVDWGRMKCAEGLGEGTHVVVRGA